MDSESPPGPAQHLRRAAEIVGGSAALAAVVGCSQQHMWNVLHGKKRKGFAAAEWCKPIAKETKGEVPEWELRPDLFEKPRKREAKPRKREAKPRKREAATHAAAR